MLSTARTRISLAVLIGFVSILVISLIPPAHAGTRAKANAASSQMTEDNDTNDGGTRNNVVDNNDNAHPSGKDRSVEKGHSGNQGKAKSDPDNNGSGPERH